MNEIEDRIVWMDLEMTGLDPSIDSIIEIATLVTDKDLNIIATGPEIIINQPAEKFEQMDNWNKNQHTKSGLWEKVLKSDTDLPQAEDMTLAFLKEHVQPKTAPLAGNSIWQDRRFIARYFKTIDDFLHYRMIDVSTIKELSKRWYPDNPKFEKKGSHRALDDINESIEELKFYRLNLMK